MREIVVKKSALAGKTKFKAKQPKSSTPRDLENRDGNYRKQMDIEDYLKIVRRWFRLLLVSGGVAGASALGISLLLTPTYDATATILIRDTALDGRMSYDSLLAIQESAKTYSQLIVQKPVLNAAIETLNLDISDNELANRVTSHAVPNTQLLEVTAGYSDPQIAAALANAVAKAFIRQFQEHQEERYADASRRLQDELGEVESDIAHLEANLRATGAAHDPAIEAPLDSKRDARSALLSSIAQVHVGAVQVFSEVSLVDEARPPAMPANPRTILITIAGVLAGLSIAFSATILIEFLERQRSANARTAGTR